MKTLPRPPRTAVALAAVLLVSGCGSSSIGAAPTATAPASSGTTSNRPLHATLAVAGSRTVRATACGSSKPFVLLTPGAMPTVRGALLPTPPAGAQVRVKVKACLHSTWQVASEQHLALDPTGAYRSLLAFPGPGAYTVRAYFSDGAHTVQSAKSYILVRP
jgi:hypothetical protein